uniref:trypsin n=1 Tax=Monopterus albus TaxID=43700 RepID=A0A3Q3QL06_MONAL|nr:hepatocyte growth factor activator isoform X1 [Monopterus albus]XP_020480064.1 hepatocyte growth factor activator isoform X1 [Monopterus albus]XP_020480065.1 hepatocyte growth factor activator isoform X1 [Monopterus albus]
MQTFLMAYIILLFLPSVLSARTRMLVPGYEPVLSKEPHRESQKVLTTMGKECKFPFRQGGRLHHHCITIFSRPWCSLTHNFDRDRQWGFCMPEKTQPNVSVHTSHEHLCDVNPCENGGVCMLIPQRHTFECSCPESFSGRLCEQKKCYETIHLHYYDIGESWGRIHLRNVEQCTCVAGEIKCERVHYTMCHTNPCHNDGTCRLITSTGKEVCNCRVGHSGPYCNLEPETECYYSRGTGYRGVVGTTESGTRCLPWNSDLLHDELHVGTVVKSQLKGLGEHAYCRNPDGDKMPWCYTLNDGAISWEYCDIPSCVIPLWESQLAEKSKIFRRASSRRINVLPSIKKREPAEKPVCGKKHKKRLAAARGRIMGGNSALPGTHPWMVAIYIGESDFCAGSLISSCWILSAAHCFFRNPLKSQLRVVLGQQHFNITSPNTRTFGVEEYFFPKQFSVFNPTLHDIVLIKLKKQDGQCVRKTPFIRPICLPDKSTRFPDQYCCTISGWGHMYEKAEGYSSLQEAGVRLVPHDTCRKPEIYGNHVTADMICAGLNGCADACQGDSGGPLACVRDDVSFLYGIISWGEGCGRSGKPGVYTKVANYIDWINSVTKRKPKAS